MQLRDTTVLITGAASGIGRSLALALAHKGANLALVDIDPGGAKATAEGVRAAGRRAEVYGADVSQQCAQNTKRGPPSSEREQRHSPAKTCRPLELQARAVAGRKRTMLVLGLRQQQARPQQPARGGVLLSKNFAVTPLP